MFFFLLYYFIFSEALVGLNAYIGRTENNRKAVVFSELIAVPPFLRFDTTVILDYISGAQSIAQKCESFHGHLSSIQTTLLNSNVINFCFGIGINQKNPSQFSNHSAALEHIHHIVSICNSPREYDFHFQSHSNSSAFGNLITSILEMREIARSSFVYISGDYYGHTNTQLPIETISNWLNRERHTMDQIQRTLILSCSAQYSNIQEMCDFLKQVSFLFSNI